MKTWNEVKLAFLNEHFRNGVKAFPDQKLRSLNYIEGALQQEFPKLLEGDTLFKTLTQEQFEQLYCEMKGRRINRYDKSVIHGLFKFSV